MNNYKTIRTALLRNNNENIVGHPLLNDHRSLQYNVSKLLQQNSDYILISIRVLPFVLLIA